MYQRESKEKKCAIVIIIEIYLSINQSVKTTEQRGKIKNPFASRPPVPSPKQAMAVWLSLIVTIIIIIIINTDLVLKTQSRPRKQNTAPQENIIPSHPSYDNYNHRNHLKQKRHFPKRKKR
jgi:hypothetical protein